MTAKADHHEQASKMVETEVIASEAMQLNAERWHLTIEEYQRYTEIMQGPLAYWNPSIDPVMALGIYADNEFDRRRYAELYAQQEHELVQRTMVFQRSYRAAFNKLFPEANIIEAQYLQDYYEHQQQKKQARYIASAIGQNSNAGKPNWLPGDRMLYFAEADCRVCGDEIKHLYGMIVGIKDVVLDIYLVGVDTEQQARQWALKHKLNIDWLKFDKVTLNINTKLYDKLNRQYPTSGHQRYYLSRGESIYAINQQQLGL